MAKIRKKEQLDLFDPRHGQISTGYFGIPGSFGGVVHVVQHGKPICGTRITNKAEYMWCARGVYREFIECKRCLAWNKNRMA